MAGLVKTESLKWLAGAKGTGQNKKRGKFHSLFSSHETTHVIGYVNTHVEKKLLTAQLHLGCQYLKALFPKPAAIAISICKDHSTFHM